jgi:hypothetical protein
MKSGLWIYSREQNRHHRRVDPLRNCRLVRIDIYSKPFLPKKIPIFSSVFEKIKNRRVTLKKRLSLRPMAQMTVACHVRVFIGAPLTFSAALIIEKFHSDRTVCYCGLAVLAVRPRPPISRPRTRPDLDYFDRQKRPPKKKKDMRVRPQQLPWGVPQATPSHLGKSHSPLGLFLEPFSFSVGHFASTRCGTLKL